MSRLPRIPFRSNTPVYINLNLVTLSYNYWAYISFRSRIPAKHLYYYRSAVHADRFVLSFAFIFDSAQRYEFAYCIPYTYTDLQNLLTEIDSRGLRFFSRDILTLSVVIVSITTYNTIDFECYSNYLYLILGIHVILIVNQDRKFFTVFFGGKISRRKRWKIHRSRIFSSLFTAPQWITRKWDKICYTIN